MEHRTTITELVIKPSEKLVSLLMSKSREIMREYNQGVPQSQLTLKKSFLVIGLASYGAINLAVGLLGLMTAKVFVITYRPSFAETMLLDSLINILFGVLILVSLWALAKGKFLAIWLYGGGMLLASIYNIAMSHGLNYFFIGFGLLSIWLMLRFKNEWELT